MKKLLIWLPLALFLGFFGLFASGLLRPDDRIISSKLVGKPLPAFDVDRRLGTSATGTGASLQ